ncbi:MAG TPA: SMI1/KNR4 family protein [Phycisphaerales bacterium]|nr:SMI1/KNR4 family protein [Phycisphaerales bacterium]
MSDPRFEASTPFTEEEISRIERVLGRPLPADYTAFVRAYGGVFVSGLVDGDAALALDGFDGADAILSSLSTLTDLRKDGILPFATCVLGNRFVLDRHNAVHYINYYGGKTTTQRLAGTFGELLPRIVVVDD